MNKKITVIALISASLLGGCATTPAEGSMPVLGRAVLADAAGKGIGTAEIVDQGSSVLLRVGVAGQTPGDHGIHLHMTGKCEAPGFTTAGGHLNPGAHQHGSLNPAGPHVGDLPNVVVLSNGSGTLDTPLSGSFADLSPTLFDGDGTAVVLHAAADDYKTDPSGNSGGRIACGVLVRNLR